jgi:pilus assembly protein Flp/PilA
VPGTEKKEESMNPLVESIRRKVIAFAREEDGVQVLEYALIIAVVVLTAVIAISTLFSSGSGTFIARVTACFTTGPCV